MDGRDEAPTGRGFPWFLVGFTAVALAILLALGTWQVQRLAWKESLIASIESRVASAPLSLAEKPSFIVPENEPARNIYYWKDIAAMADAAGIASDRLVPFFIDAGDAPNPGGLPVGGVTLIDLPNNHLQYAVTWYGLAAALAGVFAFWMIRWRKARHPAARP